MDATCRGRRGTPPAELHVAGSNGVCSDPLNTDALQGYRGARADLGRRFGLGTVQFVGETPLGPGVWAGVELDEKLGKHDGTVFGVRYFVCEAGHGVMTKVEKLRPATMDEKEQDKRVLAAARQKSRQIRRRSTSRQGPRGGSRPAEQTFADRAFGATTHGRPATDMAIGDGAMAMATAIARQAQRKAQQQAASQRAGDRSAWQGRDFGARTQQPQQEQVQQPQQPQDIDPVAGPQPRPQQQQAGPPTREGSSAGGGAASVPTDAELAMLAGALGTAKNGEEGANKAAGAASGWGWADVGADHAGPASAGPAGVSDATTQREASASAGVEAAAAQSLDVAPEQLRQVFEMARAASASAGSAGSGPVHTFAEQPQPAAAEAHTDHSSGDLSVLSSWERPSDEDAFEYPTTSTQMLTLESPQKAPKRTGLHDATNRAATGNAVHV